MRIVMVRHGRPVASTSEHRDPALSPEGHEQAAVMAAALGRDGGPRPVLTSPMLRTRETAAPLEVRWRVEASIEPAVGEIALPADLAARADRLRVLFAARWSEVDATLRDWRDTVAARLVACDADTVVVSHYFAINAAVAAATGDERVVPFAPGHCSRTVLEARPSGLRLVSLGAEASSAVT